MESLYVCLFSNGHIKVGRSVDPGSRIASHADRVACMGVELSDRFIAECAGPASRREAVLIARCEENAQQRFQSEWFAGLDFVTVCEWAEEIAASAVVPEIARHADFGSRLRAARVAAGLTQAELAKGLAYDGSDLAKAAVSTWEVGRNFPNVDQLRRICLRLNVSADALLGIAARATPPITSTP